MQRSWLRVAYALVFLVGLEAIYTGWSQIGGQAHLDLMPWWWKMLCGFGLASAGVGFTAAAAGQLQPWNKRSIVWLLISLAIIAAMGVLTYHIHVTEPPDEGDEEVTSTTVALLPRSHPRT